MSTTELLPAGVAGDASAAIARVAALQQLIAQSTQSAAGPASAGGALASSGDSATAGQSFATLLSSVTSDQTASAPGTTTSAPAGYVAYSSLLTQAAAKYGIDPALLYGVISQESAFNPNAVSSAGAEGIAQIMPENFASLGITDPFNAEQSINAGAKLLSENLATFSGNTTDAIAAYNAGAGAVEQYGGVPPYAQTQNYVQKVLAYAAQYPGVQQSAALAATGATTATLGSTAGALT